MVLRFRKALFIISFSYTFQITFIIWRRLEPDTLIVAADLPSLPKMGVSGSKLPLS
jgi:hypothetical protein